MMYEGACFCCILPCGHQDSNQYVGMRSETDSLEELMR